MPAYVNVSNVWKSVTSLYIKTASGGPFSNGWRTVTDGYVKVGTTGGPFSNGWRRIFSSALTPSIASTVTISRNNATYPSTLTGTNFYWTDSTSRTYVFQKSSDNVNFADIGSPASIANPSSGSSNTVTYALTLSDFPAFTSYYRFVVTAVNSTYSTSATSTSTSVSVSRPAPINTVQPTITPSSGTVGVTLYSVNSNGTWDPVDADGVYDYLWQSYDTPNYVSAPGTNTLSTYTPPSNFLTLGYLSPIRCRVTATNATGSTAAFSSNTATVSAVAPSASNLTTSDTTLTPGAPSSITVANTATTNQGQVSWTNGSNATSAWVSSVTPGSSYTGTDGGSLLTSQLFTITSSATAVATVNNKNNSKRVTISWDQSNSASYRVNYTVTNAGAANGTFNEDGNSSASSASFVYTLGNVSGTVRANSVTVYSSSGQSGASSTFTPGSAPQTSPTDKTSSGTGSGSVTYVAPPTVPGAPQNLARSTGNGGSKTFTWDAPVSNGGATITSYQYQVNNLGYLTTSSSSSQSVTLAAGVNTFQVRAVNSAGAGTSASTGSFTVPTINSGPSASSITSSSATISWTASNQSTYSLSIPGAPSTPYTGTTSVTHSITSLSASTSYTPTLTITSSTTDTAATTGAAFSTIAQSFTVIFNANGGTGTMANQIANTATNLTAFGFTPPAGQAFSGWSTSAGGSVVYADQASYPFTSSATLYAIYYTLPTAPSAPSPSVTSGPTQTTATVSWSAPANGGSAITSYEAQLGSSGYVNIGNVLSSSISGLTASTSYTYYVRAINAVGTSTAGSVSFTTQAAPVPSVTQIQSTNTNAGPTFMSFAITCANALSCDVRVDRAASSATAPTSSYTAGTSTLLTLSGNTGTANSTTTAAPAGSNAWYRIRVIPYTGASRTGTAGTQVASSWKRNTATSTTTTNPSPTPFGDASV